MSNLSYSPCNQVSSYNLKSKFKLIKNRITRIRMIYSQPKRGKDVIFSIEA